MRADLDLIPADLGLVPADGSDSSRSGSDASRFGSDSSRFGSDPSVQMNLFFVRLIEASTSPHHCTCIMIHFDCFVRK